MRFPPHHNFVNCGKIEEQVVELYANGNVPETVFDGFNRYHYSLVHKFRCACTHLDSLTKYLDSQDVQQSDLNDIAHFANMFFDAYVHAVGSALDIFAREVLTYFDIALPPKVYYSTAREQINALKPNDPALPYLAEPSWRQEFSDYRNTSTHERTVTDRITTVSRIVGDQSKTTLQVPLPDDPRAHGERTYTRHDRIEVYCKKTVFKALSHVNKAYGHLHERMSSAGALPL